MKRYSHLFEQIIDDKNLTKAVKEVSRTHRWKKKHIPNKLAAYMDLYTNFYVEKVKEYLINGFKNSPMQSEERYDKNAKKWRTITFPPIFPDQVVHHALIQVLEPILMRYIDPHAMASIPKRGNSNGVKLIKNWIAKDPKGTKYYCELDIKKFYDNISTKLIMDSFRKIIKDKKCLSLIESLINDGVLKGMYCSQWFANFILSPLDKLIRSMHATHYTRFVDNLTIFSYKPSELIKIVHKVWTWLNDHGLDLNPTRFIYDRNKRPINALGYRYYPNKNKGRTIIRKHRLLTIKRQIRKILKAKRINVHTAMSLLSRLGGLVHASNYNFYKNIMTKNLMYKLKHIVKKYNYSYELTWEKYIEEIKKEGDKYEYNLQSSIAI